MVFPVMPDSGSRDGGLLKGMQTCRFTILSLCQALQTYRISKSNDSLFVQSWGKRENEGQYKGYQKHDGDQGPLAYAPFLKKTFDPFAEKENQ